LHAFIEQQCGATAIIVALMMPILIGAMGLSTEVCYWYRHQRAMQNASDAAAIAAATNDTSTYAAEAKAVTAQYGLARKGQAGSCRTLFPGKSADKPLGVEIPGSAIRG
jgi:Flp pilus assembly protein TadG